MCEKWWSEHETERYHCYGPSNVRRLCCPREHNKKELGTCPTRSISFEQSHIISIMRVSCFLSNLYNLFCSWSPCPFENMVASDHTFVKKNRVVWHWGACHLRSYRCSTFTIVIIIYHTFGYHVLPHAGCVATIMPLVKCTLSVRRIVSCSLSL